MPDEVTPKRRPGRARVIRTLVVEPQLMDLLAVQDVARKGHRVVPFPEATGDDLMRAWRIMGKQCWYFHPGLAVFFPVAWGFKGEKDDGSSHGPDEPAGVVDDPQYESPSNDADELSPDSPAL